MQGKIVYTGKTKNGQEFIVRYIQPEDAPMMLEYANKISQERTFILIQGEIFTLEKEEDYLKSQLEKLGNHKVVQLVIVIKDRIMGNTDIGMQDKAENHVGTLGISLAQEIRGMGIGKLLLDLIIKEAVTNIPELKIITLGVFANNPIAIEMYRKFGFIEYGQLPEGLLHRGTFINHIFMYKKVK